MKKLFLAAVTAALVSCGGGQQVTDYSDSSNWMVCDPVPEHEVDVFYLYPTSASPKYLSMVSPIDEDMKRNAMGNYLKGAEGFSSFANMYAPYYRQINLWGILSCSHPDELTALCRDREPRTDVFAALDWYFEHLNNGRPFVLASHSQGTSMMKTVLSEYMKDHPQYMERMIAAYIVGLNITQKWLDDNGLRFAEGETDTGVIISWNAEGPGAEKDNLPIIGGTISINPLNWKRDATPAGIGENKGSVVVDTETLERRFVDGIADATLDNRRGVVVVTTTDDYIPASAKIFGDKSFHMDEWCFYYQNVKENCRKRIEAYLGHPVICRDR